jgi:preprotein translocase subunit SecY
MLKNIINTFASSLKVPELKSRIIFTLLVLLVCRLVAMIPIPGLDGQALSKFLEESQNQGGLIGMYSMFTGGALEKCAIGSLGIMPYISATIIIQLLTAVIPQLSKLAREEGGRSKIVQYGRYLTVLLCLGQGIFMTLGWENAEKVLPGFQGDLVLYENLWWYRIQTTLVLTVGTLMLMWFGEQITERGIGNGVSLVITIGILARLPVAARDLQLMFTPVSETGQAPFGLFSGLALLAVLLLVVAGIIAVTQAQRKIPVQYAQRAVGRKVYAGQSSFMPLRVNYAGVMPVIFAQAILMFPGTIFQQIGTRFDSKFFVDLARLFDPMSFSYMIIFGLMILFFSYFWVATQFNEIQISDDLKKNGGYIPGVRPGPKTTEFLHNTMSRITLAGAVFLTVIAVIPLLMNRFMKMPQEVAHFFGGTGMLILVGVMLDTMRQVESHLLMRNYDGFLKKGRVRGRF